MTHRAPAIDGDRYRRLLEELEPRVRAHVERELDALAEEFGGRLAQDVICGALADALSEYERARVRDFLPLLVHRRAREKLRAATGAAASVAG